MARHELIWRVVKEGMATLTEIETSWNFDDVLRANAILDRDADIQYLASKQTKGPRK